MLLEKGGETLLRYAATTHSQINVGGGMIKTPTTLSVQHGTTASSTPTTTATAITTAMNTNSNGVQRSSMKKMWGDDDYLEDDDRDRGSSARRFGGTGSSGSGSVLVVENLDNSPSTPSMENFNDFSPFSCLSLDGRAAGADANTGNTVKMGSSTSSSSGFKPHLAHLTSNAAEPMMSHSPVAAQGSKVSLLHSSSFGTTTTATTDAAAIDDEDDDHNGEYEEHARRRAPAPVPAPPPSIVSVSSAVCARKCAALLRAVQEGFDAGKRPFALQSGTGGAYCFLDRNEKTVCVVKPADEEPLAPNNPKGYVGRQLGEPGFKPSVRVGEAGLREVAAFLLDHRGFAGVPRTALVKVQHEILHTGGEEAGRGSNGGGGKLASLQAFVSHVGDVGDRGTSGFPTDAVHRIGILDIRIFNTDRHSGNILLKKTSFARSQMSLQAGLDRLANDAHAGVIGNGGGFNTRNGNGGHLVFPQRAGGGGAGGGVVRDMVAAELVPIDHGFCLPENLEPPYFEWLHWPQASVPFTQETLAYIASLSPRDDVNLLREELPLLRPECLRLVELTTTLLKKGAAAGMTLAELGTIISRPFVGLEEDASEFEKMCAQARADAFGMWDTGSDGGNVFAGAAYENGEDCEGEDDEVDDEHLQFLLDEGNGGAGGGSSTRGRTWDGASSPNADSFWGRMEHFPMSGIRGGGGGGGSGVDMHPSSSLQSQSFAESVSSSSNTGIDTVGALSPVSLSPEKIMRRQSSRVHQASRPVVIPRNLSKNNLVGDEHTGGLAAKSMVRGRDRAASVLATRMPWATTSISVDFSREGTQPVPTNGVLSGLDGELWDAFLSSFEQQFDVLLAREWRQDTTMSHLPKPGTSCPV